MEKEVLPKRARYYQSRMDNKTLQSGEGYGALREAWVIFITSFDPFGEGRMVYTVKRRCIEVPALKYEDGAVTRFLYVDGDPGDAPKELQELLHYMARTTPENACNAKLREIQEYVDELKQSPEVKESYMSFQDYLMAERREAVQEVEAALVQAEEERDAQTERATAAEAERDAQTERATAAEAERDAQTERATAAEAERDAQTERAIAAEAERDAQTERATAAEAEWKRVEAQRDALSIENEKLRNELARLQKQVQ